MTSKRKKTDETKDVPKPTIPFIIEVAHPDWKRPSVDIFTGAAKSIPDLKAKLLRHFYNELCGRLDFDTDPDEWTPSEIRKKYEDHVFSDYYMENTSWSYRVFWENKWIHQNAIDEFPDLFDELGKELHNVDLKACELFIPGNGEWYHKDSEEMQEYINE